MMSGVCGPRLSSMMSATFAESLPGSMKPPWLSLPNTPSPHTPPLMRTIRTARLSTHHFRATTVWAQRVMYQLRCVGGVWPDRL